MKTVVYKYALDFSRSKGYLSPTKITLSESATPLHVAVQKDKICIWVQLDNLAPQEDSSEVEFYIFGTGWPDIEEDMIYLGTIHDGSFVWHIFYRRLIGESPTK